MHNYQARRPAGDGLTCRKCNGREFAVIYTRNRYRAVVRRRKCLTCGNRMITWERPIGER